MGRIIGSAVIFLFLSFTAAAQTSDRAGFTIADPTNQSLNPASWVFRFRNGEEHKSPNRKDTNGNFITYNSSPTYTYTDTLLTWAGGPPCS